MKVSSSATGQFTALAEPPLFERRSLATSQVQAAEPWWG